jgi:hypothetical protein
VPDGSFALVVETTSDLTMWEFFYPVEPLARCQS